MEEKYEPYRLLFRTAQHFEREEGNNYVNNDVIANYRIEIGIKDSAKNYAIRMDQKGGVSLLEVEAETFKIIKNHEELEKNKDNLTAVKIFKQNLEMVKFDKFDDFIKIIKA